MRGCGGGSDVGRLSQPGQHSGTAARVNRYRHRHVSYASLLVLYATCLQLREMGNQTSAPFELRQLSAAFFSAADDSRIRDAICSVSRDTHLHRTQLPPGSGEGGLFTIDPAAPVAAPLIRVALDLDPELRTAVARTVPALASEEVFWTAYFLRVSEALAALSPPSEKMVTHPPPISPVNIASAQKAAPSTFTPDKPAPSAATSAALTSTVTAATTAEPLDEMLLLTLPEVFVYRVPPRPSARGYVAASWGLDAPLITGYLRVVAASPPSGAAPAAAASAGGTGEVSVALWTAEGGAASALAAAAAAASLSTAPLLSGHRLIAVCRIPLSEVLPPPSSSNDDEDAARGHINGVIARHLEPSADSSRYFVMRAAGSGAPVGFGFRDRQAAFDLRAALVDHCLRASRQTRVEAAAAAAAGEGGVGGDTSASAGAGGAAGAAAAVSEFALPQGVTIHVPTDLLLQGRLRKGTGAPVASPPPSSGAAGGGPRLLAPPRSHVAAAAVVSPGTAVAAAASTAVAATAATDEDDFGDFAEASVSTDGRGGSRGSEAPA